jgi:hypothetical protein
MRYHLLTSMLLTRVTLSVGRRRRIILGNTEFFPVESWDIQFMSLYLLHVTPIRDVRQLGMSYELCATNPQQSERWIGFCSNARELRAVLGRTPLSSALIDSIVLRPSSPVCSLSGGELMFSGVDIKQMGLEREMLAAKRESRVFQRS